MKGVTLGAELLINQSDVYQYILCWSFLIVELEDKNPILFWNNFMHTEQI